MVLSNDGTASCCAGSSMRSWPGARSSIAASTTTPAATSCGNRCGTRTRAPRLSCARPPAGAKGWNDALRAAQERAQAQAQEEARTPARGRAPAQDKDYHDR
jgi:hypothetical protein